jgi:DNA-binding PadR family transcriptional regulator
MTKRQSRVAAAIKYLRQDGLVDTSGRSVHHYDRAVSHWYRVTQAALADLGRRLENEGKQAYSFWCAEWPAQEMPADWKPSK